MRLFFAVWPPPQIAEQLAKWAAKAQQTIGGRVTRSEVIHLTLAFLGEIAEERVAAAVRAAHRVRGTAHTLPIEVAQLWAHNRIVWVGPREIPPELASLAESLRADLADEGFRPERRPFAAHVTLIRKARAEGKLPAPPMFTWPVDEFLLVRSLLSAKGSSYQVLARFSLLPRR